MYAMNNNDIVIEHKRNINIYYNVLDVIINKDTHGMKRIKYHMKQLNKYTPHIKFKLFSNLSVIRCYGLNNIQLQVLYNHMLFNGYLK